MWHRLSRDQKKLTGDTAALYLSHFFKVVLPLVTIPFLARVLGVEAMGLLAFAQAYAFFVLQLLEFGFGLSQTREVARHSGSSERLADITSGVVGAQAAMAVLVLLVSLAVTASVGAFREAPALLWFGIASGLLQGANFSWFLRGLEWMRQVAVLEIVFRVVRTAAIFLFIRGPEDVWMVTASDAAAALLVTAGATVLVYRRVRFRWPRWAGVGRIVGESWNLFLVRVGASFFAHGNVLVMGLFVPSTLIGYYDGATKISNALRLLFNPLVDVLYPWMSHRVAHSPAQAYRSIKKIFAGLLLLGLGMSAGVLLFAPWMVRLLLGPEFEPSVTVLRIFALFPPLAAVNLGLGNLWLLASGHQRLFVVTGLATGSLNLLLTLAAAAFLTSHAHHGAAVAFLVSQLVMATLFARRAFATGRRIGADAPGE